MGWAPGNLGNLPCGFFFRPALQVFFPASAVQPSGDWSRGTRLRIFGSLGRLQYFTTDSSWGTILYLYVIPGPDNGLETCSFQLSDPLNREPEGLGLHFFCPAFRIEMGRAGPWAVVGLVRFQSPGPCNNRNFCRDCRASTPVFRRHPATPWFIHLLRT